MGKLIDLTGQQFGRLTVIERADDRFSRKGIKKIMWLCKCKCGNEPVIWTKHLRSGHIKSCGCLLREVAEEKGHRTAIHKLSRTRIYRVWSNMKSRCYNPQRSKYAIYGGRGITVCDEWLHDFKAFYDWAMANGYQDDLSIDRIDPNLNYCPGNCRWITLREQSRNKRNNYSITINGETKNLADWCEQYSKKYTTVLYRIQRGWSPEEALGLFPTKKNKN